MGFLLHHPAVLTKLDITATNSQTPQASFNMYQDWCKRKLTKRWAAAVKANDAAGFVYINIYKEVAIASMVYIPYDCTNCTNREKFVIEQQDNNLAHGPEAININLEELCGCVLGPMQEEHAKVLEIDIDTTIPDITNCNFETKIDLTTIYPGTGSLNMAAFPCTFATGYGGALPEGSISNLITSLTATIAVLSISDGTPPKDTVPALMVLEKNNYASFVQRQHLGY